MHKIIVLSALASMLFHLSFSVVAPIANCKDTCVCNCAESTTEAEVTYSSCCSPPEVVTVKKGCCDNDKGSHTAHFTSSKNNNLRYMQFDLRSSGFNGIILSEISGVDTKNYFAPVDIVYLIFKPPIA